MGLYHSPRIVTSGLVLCLDAGNTKSYPGSGTTWTDLSGNAYNATLTNGVSYSSDNKGTLTFDGTDDYCYVASSGFFSTTVNNFFADTGYAWTISSWFRFPVTPAGTRTGNQSWAIFGQSGGIGGGETITLFVGSATDTTYFASVPYYCLVGIRGSKTAISSSSVNTNTWNNVVVTWNGTTAKVYFNGLDRGTANVGAQPIQTGYYAGIGVTGYTGIINNPPQYFEGNISNTMVYNRAITASEVLQNFNALRGRFSV